MWPEGGGRAADGAGRDVAGRRWQLTVPCEPWPDGAAPVEQWVEGGAGDVGGDPGGSCAAGRRQWNRVKGQ